MFLGKFEHNLDDKLRLTIPSKFRNKIGQTVYVSKGFDGCLEIRTQEEFQKWYQEISSRSTANSNVRLLAREILSNSSDIELDSSGRIKIPNNLLELVGIKKQVLLLGLGDRLEIWKPENYSKYQFEKGSQLEQVADQLGN